MRMKKIIIPILSLLPFFSVQAQFEKNLYTCDEETYDLLKNLSDSQLGKGSIYLFTTTHQDLAWLNHIDACIADRDTLWLTPFLKRLEEDPTFKMDIEQTSIVMEYLHRHPDTKPLFDKYIKEGRICIGGTYIQPYEEMYSGESLARQFYWGARWLKKNFEKDFEVTNVYSILYELFDISGITLKELDKMNLQDCPILKRLNDLTYAFEIGLNEEAVFRVLNSLSMEDRQIMNQISTKYQRVKQEYDLESEHPVLK